MGACASGGSQVGVKREEAEIAVSHFSIERVLGEGGFGKVNAVIKQKGNNTGGWYAMKALKKELILSRESAVVEVFSELNFLRNLNHTFLCNGHYAFQDAQYLYMVMDLALGGDLRYRLRKSAAKRFTEKQAQFYIAQVFLALDYLHSKNILHRDIKPENMIMDANGYIMLTDLGISKQLSDIRTPCTATSGTAGYMAPELYMTPNEHGVASEWFSVGVCLHEFIAGFGPYKTNGGEMGENKSTTNHTMNTSTRTSASSHVRFQKLNLKPQKHCTKQCNVFMSNALELDPDKRLVGKKKSVTIDHIKHHAWFARFDWAACEAQTMAAPFRPNTKHANVESGKYDARDMFDMDSAEPAISKEQDAIFQDYFFISETARTMTRAGDTAAARS